MKFTTYLYISALGLSILSATSCSKEIFTEINTDPNRPSSVSTPSLLVSAEKQLVNALRSEEVNYRGAQLFAQYFSQNIYTDQKCAVVCPIF